MMERDHLRNGTFFLALFLAVTSLPACSQRVKTRSVDSANNAQMFQDKKAGLAQPKFCSGKLSKNGLTEFLDMLNSAVRSEDSSPIRDSQLFADNITLVAGGKEVRLNSGGLVLYAGRLPTREDWQIIASLLVAGKLFPVGWRGCILSNGKATFVANGAGNIGLSSFDFDREWER
jgi:hypothetical protein